MSDDVSAIFSKRKIFKSKKLLVLTEYSGKFSGRFRTMNDAYWPIELVETGFNVEMHCTTVQLCNTFVKLLCNNSLVIALHGSSVCNADYIRGLVGKSARWWRQLHWLFGFVGTITSNYVDAATHFLNHLAGSFLSTMTYITSCIGHTHFTLTS